MQNEVLIIGGGLAGLAAGVALAGAGRRVRLLEQKAYLGGRARSFTDPMTGCVVDNGQHLFMGCYHATLGFLAEIGTLERVRFQPRLAVEFLERQGRSSSLTCPNLPAPWHLLAGVLRSPSFSVRQKLEIFRLGKALGSSPENGTCRPGGLTVDQWLSGLGQSESLRRNFWDLLSIAALNEDPRIASASLFERVLRQALFTSPEDSRLGLAATGLSDCYTEAARDYIVARGGKVETGRNVSCFLISNRRGEPSRPSGSAREHPAGAPLPEIGVCEGVGLADGERIEARTVLSAVPCFQLADLLASDLLRSEPFFEGVSRLQPAPIISINLWFDRPVIQHNFAGLRGTTVQWLFNKGQILRHGAAAAAPRKGWPSGLKVRDGKPDWSGAYVSLVISGAHAHVGRPREELQALALAELGELLPAARQAKLLHALVIKERFATFSPRPEAEDARPPARTPVAGLYLAGDWTSTGLPATIEGAVKSGYTAAQAVLDAG
jgi:squalene-associated FAD-dependent desaturase